MGVGLSSHVCVTAGAQVQVGSPLIALIALIAEPF